MRKQALKEKREREQEKPKKSKIISVRVIADFRPGGQEVTIFYQDGKKETRIMSAEAIKKEYGKFTKCSAEDMEKQMQRQRLFNPTTKKSKPENSDKSPEHRP